MVSNDKCQDLSNDLRFCKFMAINKYTLQFLSDEKIYIPFVTELNDPLESEVFVDQMPKEANHKQLISKRYDFQPLINGSGIYSVSELNQNENNYFTQWSHYGDQHRGLAVVIKPKQNDLAPWVPVKYCYENNDTNSEVKCYPDILKEYADGYDYVRERLECKHFEWKAEKEWRLIFPGIGAVRKKSELFFEIEGIHFGYRASKKQQNIVLQALSDDLNKRVSDGSLYISITPFMNPYSKSMTKAPIGHKFIRSITDDGYIPELVTHATHFKKKKK